MAYGERFNVDFFDVDENKFKVQIFKDGFTGSSSSNLTLGPNPVQISWKQADDYFNPIIGSNCKLQFYIDDSTGGDEWEDEETNWEAAFWKWEESGLEFLIPTFDREFKVVISFNNLAGTSDAHAVASRLKDTSVDFTVALNVGDIVVNTSTGASTTVAQVSSANIIKLSADIFSDAGGENYEIFQNYWTGFIVQDQFTIPMQSYPFLVEINASDLIGTIDGYNYELTTKTPTIFQAIRETLKNINVQNGAADTGKSLDFGYKILCRYNSKIASGSLTSNGNPFDSVYVNDVTAFQDENGNALNCKDILKSLLKIFNARIFQHEGTWTIIDNGALSLTTFSDGGGSYSKEFLAFDKTGSSLANFSIANPITNIDDTSGSGTLQPLGRTLERVIKSPAIRNRVIVDLKLKSAFENFGFEQTTINTTGYGFLPSGTNWTLQDSSGTGLKNTIVSSSTFNSTLSVQVGIEPYGGSKSLLAQGSEATSFNTLVASNNTGNIGTTSGSLSFSFAHYANDPAQSSISYTIRYQLVLDDGSGTLYYWKASTNEWVTSSTQGQNTVSSSVSEQWVLNEFTPTAPPVTGSLTVKLYTSHESLHNSSLFRTYYDDFVFKSSSDLKYYVNTTIVTESTINQNSSVIKKSDVIFGQLGDVKFSNCLTNSSNVPISAFKYFDTITSETSLENLTCMLRLNDLAINNDRYTGTFRKIKESYGYLKPVDLLTLPKLNFTTFQSATNHLAIDNITFNLAKNRIKINTHTPQQTKLTATTDVSNNRSFYEEKPSD